MCGTQESAPTFKANQSWNQFYPRCLLHLTYELMHKNRLNDFIRDRPLENLWGGGGTAGEVPKKYSRKGKLNKKIHARQLILKNIHAMA